MLNVFSKSYEKKLKTQLTPYIHKTLSLLIPAHRNQVASYRFNKNGERMKIKLNDEFIVRYVLMVLFKDSGCIPN